MAPIEVKQILSFCQTRMHVTVTVHCLHIYIRSACIVLRVFMTRKQAAYVYRKTLWTPSTCSFRWSQTRTHECFRWSQTRIRNPFCSLATCCKSREILVPDPATVHCGQHYDLKAKLPGGGKFWEKNLKGDFKNIFWQRKIRPKMLNKSGRKRAGQIGREI